MAKKPDEGKTTPIRVNRATAAKIQRIAGALGKSTGDYLDELLQPVLKREMERAMKELEKLDGR